MYNSLKVMGEKKPSIVLNMPKLWLYKRKKGFVISVNLCGGSIPITSPCPNNCAPDWQVRGEPNECHQIVKLLDLEIRRCLRSPDNLSEPQIMSTASSPRLWFMKVVDRVYVTIRVNRDVEITTDDLTLAYRIPNCYFRVVWPCAFTTKVYIFFFMFLLTRVGKLRTGRFLSRFRPVSSVL